MKVGVNVTMINPGTRPDDDVYQEELALIDLVEPLGFDSLMCVEHHFTGFAMIPNNLQLLAYVAGRTKRIQLVTDVIVLPWRDPIRVAEEVATLDVMCGGRTIFGFGRGAAPVEYEGFGIPMEESRERFKEAAEIVIKGMTRNAFPITASISTSRRSASGRGRCRIPSAASMPRRSVRNRPKSWPSWASASSSSRKRTGTARGPTSTVIARPRRSVGLTPRPPICTCNVLVGDDHAEVWDQGHTTISARHVQVDQPALRFYAGPASGAQGFRVPCQVREDLRQADQRRRRRGQGAGLLHETARGGNAA